MFMNPFVSVWYEELYDAVALHDVKDLAISLHIKAKDLVSWYETEFDTKLQATNRLLLLE